MTVESKNIEQKIILQVIEGNQTAFENLYNIYADKLYYFALRFLKTKEDAENLTQDVFVKIWETRDRLDPDFSFNAYLFTIAKNTIFNLHRKRVNELAYREYLGNFFDFSHSKTESDLSLKDLQERIDQSVEKFPTQRKIVYELSRKEGLSHKEIAEQLKISEKTIETHIRLALKTLRKVVGNNLVLLVAAISFEIIHNL
ncbi:MAG: RNA polymerase sigma-70 factor [Tenuifilaceae bacterium]